MASSLTINKGSDLTFSFVWPDEDGEPIDLTGYTADFFELHPALLDNLTVGITDPENGELTISMDWVNGMPYGNSMFFRVRITLLDFSDTLPLIYINVA